MQQIKEGLRRMGNLFSVEHTFHRIELSPEERAAREEACRVLVEREDFSQEHFNLFAEHMMHLADGVEFADGSMRSGHILFEPETRIDVVIRRYKATRGYSISAVKQGTDLHTDWFQQTVEYEDAFDRRTRSARLETRGTRVMPSDITYQSFVTDTTEPVFPRPYGYYDRRDLTDSQVQQYCAKIFGLYQASQEPQLH